MERMNLTYGRNRISDRSLKIGEFSELTGISKRMLRHYDKLGIFSPVTLDQENGYRYYNTNQIEDLQKIQFLRRFGFTLAEVKGLLSGSVDVKDFLEILKDREQQLSVESDELKSNLMLVKRTIMYLENEPLQRFPSLNQLLNIEGSMAMQNQKQTSSNEMKSLMNRDLFMEKMEEVFSKDQNDSYQFLTFDIDNFMQVNDRDGFDVGDEVILKVFTTVMSQMKSLLDQSQENLMARLGGDEFSIFLKNPDVTEVNERVEAIIDFIHQFDFSTIGCTKPITISCGIARGQKPQHMALLKDQSVKALMEAKRKGRNQYCIKSY